MATPAIELDGLGRAYGERVALADVTLSLEAGRTLVVFGPNGAGKSTLLRVLATLLRPHAGSATVLGHDVARAGHDVRAHVGLLAHDALVYRELTARENLEFHARLRGLPLRRVDEVLALTGLAPRARDRAGALSRGLLQRLAAARAVLHDPPVLLLDEPWANLDPAARAALEPLVGRASGRTRVVTSHDPAGGLAEADLALGLRGGRPALLAPAGELDAAAIGALYA